MVVLVDMLKMREKQRVRSLRARRRTVRWNGWYRRYIAFARRWRWATIVLVVLAFGLPFGQLPDTVMKDPLRRTLDRTLGGSIGLFLRHSHSNFYRDTERPSLYIRASLPDGCTTAQLNEVVLAMENYLAQFEEIESFRTSVTSHSNASIVVNFRPGVEKTSFPVELKGRVMAKAADLGGANWSVYGVTGQSFNNNVNATTSTGIAAHPWNDLPATRASASLTSTEKSGGAGRSLRTSLSWYGIPMRLPHMAFPERMLMLPCAIPFIRRKWGPLPWTMKSGA